MRIKRSQLKKIIREAVGEEPIRKSLVIPIPKDLTNIHSRIKSAGRELFLVGGAVRDALMGKSPKDYDVATNASPEEIIKILQRDTRLKLDLTGKQFGVVRVKTPEDGEYEIATFREDIGKGKATKVKFSTIEADVQRRDLTINALFYDMDSSEVVDYVGGIKDIENGVIRAVGEPGERFDEDRIRILRAIRFAGRMGADLDPKTKQAILEDNELIDTDTGQPIPADRITEEFVKGLKSSADINHLLSLTKELGMFQQILPGLEIELGETGTSDHIAQIAALLKNNSPDIVVPVLKRMRYSNDETKTIKFLLQLISLNIETAAGLKKDFNRQKINPEHLHNFAEIVDTVSEAKVRGFLEFAAAPPAGSPKELMAQGLKGPEIGLAMANAESEAYADFIGEVRQYVRELIRESHFPLEGNETLRVHHSREGSRASGEPQISGFSQKVGAKPNGLWYECQDGSSETWEEFCDAGLSTGYGKYDGTYNVVLNDYEILFILDEFDFKKFNKMYSVNHPSDPDGSKGLDKMIDWPTVASHYAGIEICPYRADKRNDDDAFWYYGWDVASGCVWNSSGVKEVISADEGCNEANEYEWSTSSKKNMMLDKDGMEKEDKDNQENYLKSMALMESILLEQEVKFSGILKIMPSVKNIELIESLIYDLPPEAIPLPIEKFHVTLIHQSILKPYKEKLKALKLPLAPSVIIEPTCCPRINDSEGKKSWVVWVKNQADMTAYVNEVMKMIGGPSNPEPERVFHITVANLSGNPGDSVK
jgi:tRNA nucleotidyltransferase/poly(A) polymerase